MAIDVLRYISKSEIEYMRYEAEIGYRVKEIAKSKNE